MKKKTIAIIAIIIVVLVLIAILALGFVNARTDNNETVRLNIKEGTTYTEFRELLKNEGVEVGGFFDMKASLMGLDKRVPAGSYAVKPNTNEINLIRKLRNAQQDPVRLTIGKFRTPQQLNEYLNSKLMHDDFNITLDSFYIILPDTYEFYWTVTPEQFMQRMEKEFTTFMSKSAGLKNGIDNFKDVIILASIVEEETNYNPEKPLIARVYINRLDRGMPLQADPTVKYAVGDFSLRRILNKHLDVESPFNTYKHTGLPPAPICLPSKSSITAVFNAPEANYLYFCASDKMDGTHRFATTLAEHNRNAAAFHAALNRRGIK